MVVTLSHTLCKEHHFRKQLFFDILRKYILKIYKTNKKLIWMTTKTLVHELTHLLHRNPLDVHWRPSWPSSCSCHEPQETVQYL